MLCFHALRTRQGAKGSTENEQWLLYNEICQRECFKKCKKHLKNPSAGSCPYMRNTTITPRLATTQYHASWVTLRVKLLRTSTDTPRIAHQMVLVDPVCRTMDIINFPITSIYAIKQPINL